MNLQLAPFARAHMFSGKHEAEIFQKITELVHTRMFKINCINHIISSEQQATSSSNFPFFKI
jgi:hypothetical protein